MKNKHENTRDKAKVIGYLLLKDPIQFDIQLLADKLSKEFKTESKDLRKALRRTIIPYIQTNPDFAWIKVSQRTSQKKWYLWADTKDIRNYNLVNKLDESEYLKSDTLQEYVYKYFVPEAINWTGFNCAKCSKFHIKESPEERLSCSCGSEDFILLQQNEAANTTMDKASLVAKGFLKQSGIKKDQLIDSEITKLKDTVSAKAKAQLNKKNRLDVESIEFNESKQKFSDMLNQFEHSPMTQAIQDLKVKDHIQFEMLEPLFELNPEVKEEFKEKYQDMTFNEFVKTAKKTLTDLDGTLLR